MNINQILLISHYEAKLLRRNWLFIFLVFLLVGGSLAAQWFIQVDFPIHFLNALSCSIPFVSAFLFNFIQGIFILFIAGDFIRRDRSLDSFESLSTRSHGNGDYAMGKLLAGHCDYMGGPSIFNAIISCFFPVCILFHDINSPFFIVFGRDNFVDNRHDKNMARGVIVLDRIYLF